MVTHIPQWISTDFEIFARMRTTLANEMLEGNLRELKLSMPLFCARQQERGK